MLEKDTAICIKTVDYSETSQIVTFFTKDNGKVSAIAKGSKRLKSPFDGTIEMLSLGNIIFSDPNKENLATLTEFEQKHELSALATNSFNLNCCFFAAELINKLTDEHDPYPDLFESFLTFLRNLTGLKEKEDSLRFLIIFQLNLLKEIGLQPVLNSCSNCKNSFNTSWTESYFSSSANGIICKDCEAGFTDKINLTVKATNCLANLNTLGNADENTLRHIEKILVYHFTELLRTPPKMAKYILKL